LKRSVKIGLIALVLTISAALIYTSASDNIFFTTMRLAPDNIVTDLKGEGYELSFYMYGNADSEKKVKIATVFHDIKKSGEDLAHIIFKIIPEDNFKVDSLQLEFMMLQPTSALILENPESGQSNPFIYTRTDHNTSVALDFPELDAETSETITIDSWLDLSEMDTITEDKLLFISFSIHEESVFKIVKYEANSVLNLDIPFTTQ
jgi:hypothetical protein